ELLRADSLDRNQFSLDVPRNNAADVRLIGQARPAVPVGNHVAGITGALVATFFMCGPACTVSFFVARVFDRFKDKPWRKAIQAGLVPVSVGLVASTALLIARSADRDIATLVVTGVTFALTYWTRISPLYALGAATAIGMAGGL
ncbi:MAG: chromate transporter, partial [Xanthobacteraceae bacterium]